MKGLLLASLFLLTVIGGFFWYFRDKNFTITLTEEDLKARLDARFPFEKTYFFLLRLRFENPDLSLEEGSERITFACDMATSMTLEFKDPKEESFKGVMKGSARVSGEIRYSPSTGSFYLESPLVEKLEIGGVPAKWQKKLSEAARIAAREFLGRAPLYTLKPTDVKKAATLLVLKDVTVRDRKLIITLGGR